MEETKRCPYCGEEILAVAKKCKHCGEWLEAKGPEKEMKACPVCGELVDADIEVCPYCKEPTCFKKQVNTSKFSNQEESIDDDEFNEDYLYCKSCGSKIHANSSRCMQCGDGDPFFYKKISRLNILLCIITLILTVLFLAFLGYLGASKYIYGDLKGWRTIPIDILVIGVPSYLIWSALKNAVLLPLIEIDEDAMKEIFDKNNDPSALERWKAKLKRTLS